MLENTGERIIPEQMKITNGMLLEHLARYYFALHYTNGRVLDFACGTGYGSNIVAKSCKDTVYEVIGVDNSKDAIGYAKQKYYHPNIKFYTEDVTDPSLPETLGSFDVILSFETIEHIENESSFLDNIHTLLKPGGTLVISTPFGAGRGKPSNEPYHVHQLTENEFKELFKDYSKTEFYYQKSVLIEPKKEDKHYSFGIVVCKK